MMYNIISFVGRTLKDLDLYRDLLLKYPSMIGPSIVSVWPFITPHVNAGNLIGLEAELSKFDRAQILSEASRDLYSCLKHRFGLAEQLGNF